MIRPATREDYDNIYHLVRTAFATARVKDGKEQDFVNKLRASSGYIPQLELVMEVEGELIGHIMFTKLIVPVSKGDLPSLLVAPLCVKLAERNKGYGSQLMKTGFSIAKDLGYTSAFLVGDPEYYQRFGFRPTGLFGIKNKSDIPDRFVLCCELLPGALKDINGYVKIE